MMNNVPRKTPFPTAYSEVPPTAPSTPKVYRSPEDPEQTNEYGAQLWSEKYAEAVLQVADMKDRMNKAATMVEVLSSVIKCGDEETSAIYQQRIMNLLVQP